MNQQPLGRDSDQFAILQSSTRRWYWNLLRYVYDRNWTKGCTYS